MFVTVRTREDDDRGLANLWLAPGKVLVTGLLIHSRPHIGVSETLADLTETLT